MLQSINPKAGFATFNDSLQALRIEASKPSPRPPHYRKSFEFHNPWMNTTLYCLIKERSKLHKQMKKQPLNCLSREKSKPSETK